MGWPTLALLGLSTLTIVVSYHLPDFELQPPIQRHIPPPQIPSFQRTSVEKHPEVQNDPVEFGSQSLPLRSAVEASPRVTLKLEELKDATSSPLRVPLRDAVEQRPPPPLGVSNIVSHDSIWLEQVSPPVIRRIQGPLKVVCHLDAAAVYRKEPFALYPQSIPSRKCTHVVYNGATLDAKKLTVIPRDPEYNEIKGGYETVLGLRKKDPLLQILISVVPINEGSLYRDDFGQSILEFLEKYKFDGVEIDFKTWSNHQLKWLLTSLYSRLTSRGYTLAVTVRPGEPVDPDLADVTDMLLLQVWKTDNKNYATCPAPLEYVSSFTKQWIYGGIPPSKIILDVPLFGNSYTLKFKNATSPGSPVIGPGLVGAYTKQPGRLAFYEVCEKIDNLWQVGIDKGGSYLKRGDQWIGYEDPLSIKLKAAFIRSSGLGGISLRSLDLDDTVGICGEPWPMLNAATDALGIFDSSADKCYQEGVFSDPDNCAGFRVCDKGKLYRGDCGFGRFFSTQINRCKKADAKMCNPGHSERLIEITSPLNALRVKQRSQKLRMVEKGSRVVCYVTSWAMYRKGVGKFVPEHLDTRLCTDVVYAFAGLNADTLLIQPFDPWADIDNGLYERITSVKESRVLLAIGGWTDSTGDKYSRLVRSRSARKNFITSTINFLLRNNFDGLSVEWNYPKCWQSNCNKGPAIDRPNFTKLIKELKAEFENTEPRLTLAVALSGYKEVIDRAYDVRDISAAADFISVMTYDYHGAWESQTGHLAPLYATPGDSHPHYNVNWTMNYLSSLGADKSKLLAGIAFYGQAFRLAQDDRFSLGDPAAGPGKPGEFTGQPGMLAYYEICQKIKNEGWKRSKGPSASYKDQFVSYEDRQSIAEKGAWLRQNGYGGATAWTVDLDDFTNRCCFEPFPLLRSLNRALGRLLDPTPLAGNCERPSEPITPQPPTMTTHSDADDGVPRPSRPMTSPSTTSIKPTTWPTWTERPSKKPTTVATTWPTWTWRPSTTASTTTTIRAPTEWTTTTETSGENIYSTTSSPDKPCSFGEYVPDPANCRNYFRCVLGEFRRESCAPGLHWDGIRGRCDWPSTARCQQVSGTQSTQKPTVTTESWRPPTTSPRPTRPVSSSDLGPQPSKECQHGQYYPYPQSCSSFLICVNGELILQHCGPGLTWNEEKNMCDWPFTNSCKNKPMKHSPLIMRDMIPEPCQPGSVIGVPGDCKSYQTCLWGRHMIFSCAPGLHFNTDAGVCDWPHLAKCDEGPSEPDEPIQIATTTTTHRPTKIPTRPSGTPTTKPPITTTTQNSWDQWTEKPKPLPPPEIDGSLVSPLSGHFKVVCYFTNWAWYRRGVGKYLPENIDHTLCTHIVYGFAVLDYSDLTIKAHDSWADYDNRFYERVVAYKKRGLKILLALGGWNDSAGDKYSRLVNSPSSRRKFIDYVIKFIEKYDFDGLDLDWEYPVCWQVDCKKGPASDKEGFAALLKELRSEFTSRDLLLSAAVSPSKTVIDKGYDVPALAKYLDWIAVMAYDYHGQWDKKTGHVAPLYHHEDDEFYFFNANYSINYWISKGAPARSIVMGMPLYGQAFSINDPHAGTGLNVPASAGLAGEFTQAAGFLAYYEICDRIHNRGWTVYQDPQRRMGPYAHKGNQWVSFDDADMLRQKAQFIRDMGLGGGMIWALDLDDFKGRCGEGKHPLLHTLQQVLADPPTKHDRPIALPAVGEDLDWKMPSSPPKQMPPNGELTTEIKNDNEFKVVCYFTNWAWYRPGVGKFLPEDIDSDLCTHIIYGFAVLDGTSFTIKPHDSWADLDNRFYERVVAYKKKGIKVLIAIGGWNDSAGDKYSRLVNSPSARQRFITHVIQFIEKHEFDGLDLDWEYPVCWQVDCNAGPKEDKESFATFVKELSRSFKPKGLLLSSAVSPSKRVINAGYDVPALAQYLDWISVMAYDFHGQWDKKTGHVAPLYKRPDDWEPTFNANFSVHYWLSQGTPAKKLIMGAPLYGQSFSLAERSVNGLNSPTYGGGEAGEETRARGFLAYYEICERILKKDWTVVQDPERRIGPYAYKGDQWVSFDDVQQMTLKAELIKSLGLGGGMVWALDLDDFKNRCDCEPSPLLRTMNRVLRNYPPGPSCSITESNGVPEVTQNPYDPPSSTPDVDPVDSIEVEAGPAPPTPLPIGECEGKLFLPHAHDCSKYLICNFGQISEMACPNGLHWNNDRCDWPENTECNVQSKTIEESNDLIDYSNDQSTDETGIFVTKFPSRIPWLQEESQGNKKLICYFTNWARYRPESGKFSPENIDSNLCTHIVYAFTVLDPEKLTIKLYDPSADIDNDFFGRITAFKAKGIKVMVALGGWNDSADDKYSRLVNSRSARNRFVKHAVKFVEQFGFDGLDLDWEYPVCWHVECERGPSSDKKGFSLLVKELSEVFKPRNLLLSAAVSPSKRVIDYGYDVPTLAKYLDWIAVMTYDFHGHWEKKTGHVAPLYYYPGDEFDYFNANFSMRYWIQKGAQANRLVMGVPLYGQSFTLSNRAINGLQSPAFSPGRKGSITGQAGFLAFHEICDNVHAGGWEVHKDSERRIGPYAVGKDQWVSYDDVSNVLAKAAFIRELNLAGGMIWALDLDDFNGKCGCGKYPLLTALNRGLGEGPIDGQDCT